MLHNTISSKVVQNSCSAGEGVEGNLLGPGGHLVQHVHEVVVELSEGDPSTQG